MFEAYPGGSLYTQSACTRKLLPPQGAQLGRRRGGVTRGHRRRRTRESIMGLGKKAKDKAKVVKGKIKKNAGKATGNRRLKAKGKAGEAIGKLKLKGEKAKDSVKR
jgi:uncharacterized protein YjbJ (UPF0337 family)